MWDLPGPGLEPVSPALAGGFLTTVPPGKPSRSFLRPLHSGFTPLKLLLKTSTLLHVAGSSGQFCPLFLLDPAAALVTADQTSLDRFSSYTHFPSDLLTVNSTVAPPSGPPYLGSNVTSARVPLSLNCVPSPPSGFLSVSCFIFLHCTYHYLTLIIPYLPS